MRRTSVKPHLFSKHFGLKPEVLAALGVFDPTLNIDTPLFPDPLLLESSNHPEMTGARPAFEDYFDKVRRLLLASEGDHLHLAWTGAFRLLSFPEVKGTCLGYGAGTISGSGSGPQMTGRLAETGYQIAKLGIDDPDLFMAVGLFEKDFGPDLIGDMFTNVCFGEIAAFNERICKALGVQTSNHSILLKNGKRYEAQFAKNPCIQKSNVPVILTPLDVLRDLPIALNWSGVQEVSERNQEFRDGLNGSILNMWSRRTLESKSQLKEWALSGPAAFSDLLDMIHGMDGKPYDFAGDKLGEIVWRSFADHVLQNYPFVIAKPQQYNPESIVAVVDKIIEQFRHLVEDRDLWRELYTDNGQPRLEKAAQRLFYMTALSYCEANNLDITPEAESGRGPVDFKFSQGIKGRVLVEIKLSRNGQVPHVFSKQLSVYNSAERPIASYYIVINVGGMSKKIKHVEVERQRQMNLHGSAPSVLVINGLPRLSASKTTEL